MYKIRNYSGNNFDYVKKIYNNGWKGKMFLRKKRWRKVTCFVIILERKVGTQNPTVWAFFKWP